MKIRLLEIAALSLQLSSVLGASSNGQVGRWIEQASSSVSPIPVVQSDPAYDYTAVKFTSNSEGPHIDALATKYASATGWEHVGQLGTLPRYRVFRKLKPTRLGKRSDIVSVHERAAQILPVETVAPLRQKTRRLYKRGTVEVSTPIGWRYANDTAWREITDPLYSQQWHLVNTKEIGHDINVTGVWHQGITGAGVTVALIDDGLDYSNDDLLPNFDFRGSYDFNDNTKLPTPRLQDDYHGTRCAGQIAAVRNDVCGVGVAYGGRVAGIRMLSKEITDQDEIMALNYAMDTNWIYSCSWGPNDDGVTVQGPGKIIEDAFINGIENGRNGLGSIYVFATGNGGGSHDNCNFDGYTNSIYTVSIGAINHLDQHPYYSERCSAQLAVTYSNGDNRGIVTTDLGLRKCTNRHGGTSAAAPLGAGVFALALSVRPDLTWRDIQHLAVRTAIPIDLQDSDWADVAEGRKYNHKYGFGKMDAWRIVEAAKSFVNVGKQTQISMPEDKANEKIPPLEKEGGESKPVERSVEVTKEQVAAAKMKKMEHATVVVDMEHRFRGNVEIWLQSPKGVRSQLAAVRQRDSSNKGLEGWKFMTVKHWDEDPVGKWTLQVRNAYKPKLTGTLKSWKLTLYGESTEPEPHHDVPSIGTETPPVPTLPVNDNKEKIEKEPSNGLIGKGAVILLSGAFFISGLVVASIAMLFYMRRREHKLNSMQWTPLSTIGNSREDEEVIFSRGGPTDHAMHRLTEDDDDDMGDAFEYADITAGSSERYRDNENNEEAMADSQTHSNSNPELQENERLV
ncbi:pheromone processing endoprotease [Coemansia sp. RSA 989]|nr:peptidase S8/S53 domain-containing protein [Coemansia mojavensis]KAJ1742586.1 pheromone processing endoprotease [Coemansia sp. RSA 1086]KAJ1751250.1 pheromone processing endoprotease [Coemansia sp. RSA 1821]KAJ1865681.1 pheromone processing endoprotease [Coemansia sp. RSA 989]KAJ1872932.1 pheromone processing endoprotease [Coemansia sp. RSA 990]KAJ2630572.1 pheromone processing endoprotease [Coemansia sp. RSA 1290]KAJ2672113.1 pheromone processing endoprotease [Coemansia sp. RSA 1085]